MNDYVKAQLRNVRHDHCLLCTKASTACIHLISDHFPMVWFCSLFQEPDFSAGKSAQQIYL